VNDACANDLRYVCLEVHLSDGAKGSEAIEVGIQENLILGLRQF